MILHQATANNIQRGEIVPVVRKDEIDDSVEEIVIKSAAANSEQEEDHDDEEGGGDAIHFG